MKNLGSNGIAMFRGGVSLEQNGGFTSVGFLISDRQEGPFQLDIAWIKASPPPGD